MTLNLITCEEMIQNHGPLSAEDLQRFFNTGPGAYNVIIEIKEFHHRLAHMLASGRTPSELIQIFPTLSPSRLTTMQRSPAFRSLVQYYRTHFHDEDAVFRGKMQEAGLESLTKLHTLVTDSTSLKEVRETFVALADRIGHSPVKKAEVVHHAGNGISATELSQITTQVDEEEFEDALWEEVPQVGEEESSGSEEGQLTELPSSLCGAQTETEPRAAAGGEV